LSQPPTPPGGGSKPPDFGEMTQKLRAAQGPNRLIMIAGLLFFVDSFLPWYGVLGFNVSGWTIGGWATFAILAAIAATVLAAADVLGATKDMKIPAELMLGLCGGALVFSVLRWLTLTRATKYGLFFGIILGAVMTYAGYQKYQASKSAG